MIIRPAGMSEITFTSLTDGEFLRDPNKIYVKWKNGYNAKETNRAALQELVDEMVDIYGFDPIYVKISYDPDIINNAAYTPLAIFGNVITEEIGVGVELLEGSLNDQKERGRDFVVSVIAHEVGHMIIMKLKLDKLRILDGITWDTEINAYENEACADYLAGLTMRLCRLDPKNLIYQFDNKYPKISPDEVHPGSSIRKEVFQKGYDRIDNGEEAINLNLRENTVKYDTNKVYADRRKLKNILLHDVVNPIRREKKQKYDHI